MLRIQVEVLAVHLQAQIGLIDQALDWISIFAGKHHRRIAQLGALEVQLRDGGGSVAVNQATRSPSIYQDHAS